MRVRRVYTRVSLGGFGLLACAMLLFLLGDDAVAAYGFFFLTFYWVGLCVLLGLILASGGAVRRLAGRLGSRPK